jgi:predicted RNase H-like nuclease (RuvC/YqgF family)
MPPVADIEALKQKRRLLAGRVTACEGRIRSLERQMEEEKAKPCFKSSKDPRHQKFQLAARRRLEELQRALDDAQKERAALNADVKTLSLVIKGQATLPLAPGRSRR